MKRLFVGGAVLLACVGIAAVANAQNGKEDVSGVPFTTDSGGYHPEYSGVGLDAFETDGERATDTERDALLGILLAERPREGNVGPLRSEVEGVDTSRVLLDNPEVGQRVAAFRTKRGDTCKVATRYRQPYISGCTQQFQESGLAVSYRMASPDRASAEEFIALVADDVTSVKLRLTSGQIIDVPFDNNAIWWVGAKGQHPAELVTVRDGETFETGEPFVSFMG